MATIQKQIRDAIFQRLTEALPGVNLYRSRRTELDPDNLPAIVVYSSSDRPSNGDEDSHDEPHERVYSVSVDVRAIGDPEEDATDALAVAVRHAVLSDQFLSGISRRITWTSQQWDGEVADHALAGTGLTFDVFYKFEPEEEA